MSHECAFPQPITPSGYELNHENQGLTKREWLAYKLFINAWSQNMNTAALERLAKDCWIAADAMMDKPLGKP